MALRQLTSLMTSRISDQSANTNIESVDQYCTSEMNIDAEFLQSSRTSNKGNEDLTCVEDHSVGKDCDVGEMAMPSVISDRKSRNLWFVNELTCRKFYISIWFKNIIDKLN